MFVEGGKVSSSHFIFFFLYKEIEILSSARNLFSPTQLPSQITTSLLDPTEQRKPAINLNPGTRHTDPASGSPSLVCKESNLCLHSLSGDASFYPPETNQCFQSSS